MNFCSCGVIFIMLGKLKHYLWKCKVEDIAIFVQEHHQFLQTCSYIAPPTGSTALQLSRQLVAGNMAQCALALGFEKMQAWIT